MKKNVWLLGMAVAALTSCTQSEVLDVPEGRKIEFDGFVNKTTRNANDAIPIAQKSNMTTAYLMGYEGGNLFLENRALTYTSGTYTYGTHEHWHVSKPYNFSAYSDGNANLTKDTQVKYETITGGSKLTFVNYTPSNKDLLAAIYKTVNTDANALPIGLTGGVPLNFQHMLSCVQINFTSSETDKYLKVSNIYLAAIKTATCTYSVTDNNAPTCSWEGGSIVDNAYTFSMPDNEYVVSGSPYNELRFVIPQSSNIDISFTVTTYERSGEEGSYTYAETGQKNYTANLGIQDSSNPGNFLSWVNGVQYKYTATLAGNANEIHFNVAVDTWGPPQEQPITPTVVP